MIFIIDVLKILNKIIDSEVKILFFKKYFLLLFNKFKKIISRNIISIYKNRN